MSYFHLLILLVILVSSLIKNLSFVQHISAISKSCFHNIRDLKRICNTIDQTIVYRHEHRFTERKLEKVQRRATNLSGTLEIGRIRKDSSI